MGHKLICWADTQLPLYLLRDLSQSLGLPQSDVRVIANYAVGGYGGKTPEKIATLSAIMAKRTGRPVKAVFSRAEDFIGTHRRYDYKNHNKIGVKKDGTITAIHSRIIANWGADTAVPYIGQTISILGACSTLYRSPNNKAETVGVLTNILDYGAMNGFGDPEALYALERVVDEAAEAIDMDPVAFRRKNCMRYGDRAMVNAQVATGPIEWGIVGPDLDIFPELIEKCAEKAGWKDTWKGWRTPVAVDGVRRRGIGIAIGTHHTENWPSSAIVEMNQDGSANVLSGAVEIGQGYATAISQVVAEVIGIRYEDVNPILADTNVTPATIGNVASTGVSSPINAARVAAEGVKAQLLNLAAERLNAPADELEARDGSIYVKGTANSVPIADICFTNWQITGTGNNPPAHLIKDKKTGEVIHAYAAAVTIAEVEVDLETGLVDVIRITSAHDTGRTINPVIVENHIDLGLTMAAGWVRSEEYVVDSNTGVMMNPNFVDYKLMTFLDMPTRENTQKIIMEKPSAHGPFGAKGMSETPMIALAPAIANAIYNAIGVRMHSGSLMPANILKAMKESKLATARSG
jgi:xanthine dehydrogenase molybdenum-binding subunit